MANQQAEIINVTEKLAAFAADLTYDKIPEVVRQQVKKCVLDNLGVMVAGATAAVGTRLSGLIREFNDPPEARLIGLGHKVSARNAAFFNAAMLPSCNGMSGYRSVWAPGMHPQEVALPVALSFGEKHGIDGKTFMTAFVAGNEVATRLALGTLPSHFYKGFHQCATLGCIGGAATAGNILGLSSTQMAEALGAATVFSPMAIINLQMSLLPPGAHLPPIATLDSGQGASSAILAVLATLHGFGGAPYALENPIGFCSATTDEADLPAIVNGLGQEFTTAQMYYKLYCVTRWFSGAIDITLDLMERYNITADNVDRVVIKTIRWLVLRAAETSTSSNIFECLDASFPYTIAHTLLRPQDMLSPDLCTDEERPSKYPEIHEFSRRIEVVEVPEFTDAYPGKILTEIEIYMKNGTKHSGRSEAFRGDEPEMPLTSDELEAKFSRFAGRGLDKAQIEEAKSMVSRLEELDDITRLVDLFVPR